MPMKPSLDPAALQLLLRGGSLSVLFQPIVDLAGGRLFGFEACVRGPADSPLHSPLTLFEAAARAGCLLEAELAACETGVRAFMRRELSGALFINATPLSFVHPEFRHFLSELIAHLDIAPSRVVIELTEQYPMDDYERLRGAITDCRAHGFQIALDDLGAGYAGLRIWSELRPDYVKIDRHFIEGINDDPTKQGFVASIQDVASRQNCKVIAEGIETEEELEAVLRLGLKLGQGYLLGRPRPLPDPTLSSAVIGKMFARWRNQPGGAVLAGALAEQAPQVGPDAPAERVLDRFNAEPELGVVAVVDKGTPVGYVTRHRMLDLFSARYHRELHGRKDIRRFVDTRPVMVDENARLEDVSQQLTDDSGRDLRQWFLVMSQGRYLGMARTRSLLQRLTEQQLRSARHSNPLTLLPGSVPLHEFIDASLAAAREFRIAYCDLNSFKPYNDVFGYNRGDSIILLVADILRRHADPELDLVGHVGGDDFVVVFGSADWERRCAAVLTDFRNEVLRCYPDDALARGGILCEDRRGRVELYGLLSLAIGVAHPDPERCVNHHDVAALATTAKKKAKQIGGNSLYVTPLRAPQERGDTPEEAAAA